MDTPSNNPRRQRLEDLAQRQEPSPARRYADAFHARELANLVGGEMATVGWLFGFLGGLMSFLMFRNGHGIQSQVLAVANTVVLIGPAVWYIFAARYVKKGRTWVIGIVYKVFAAQAGLVAGLLVLGAMIGWPRRGWSFALPALLAVYFIPAMLAVCWRLNKVAKVAPMLDRDVGRAFEPIRVQPVEPASDQKGGFDGSAAQG